MIVEPVPTNPRSPIRRGLRVAAMTIPLVLLVGVVAAGVLGPRDDPGEAAPADPSAAVAQGSSPAPGDEVAGGEAAGGEAAAGGPALVIDGRPVEFPETWIGLTARSVADTLAERTAGGALGVVAVTGYLSYGSVSWTCVDAYLEADREACAGRTLLADVDLLPGADGAGFGQIGPHLHPVFPAGVRGPAPADDPAHPRAEPIPVVLLGRFTDPPGITCEPGTRDCGRGFAVERVVWVAGELWQPVLTVDPAMDVDPNIPEIAATVRAAAAALGRGSLPLSTSVVRPDVLAVVDPVAAAALPVVPDERRLRPVTYARGLFVEIDEGRPLDGNDPVIGWVVLDSISGEVLARGGLDGEPMTYGTRPAPDG